MIRELDLLATIGEGRRMARRQEESTTTIGNAMSGCTASSLGRVGGEAVSRVGPAARREEGGRPGAPGGDSLEGLPLERGSTRDRREVISKNAEKSLDTLPKVS
jgi:hypothetical protein